MDAEKQGSRHRVAVAAAAAGQRLDRVLADALPALSRTRLKALIEAGHLRLDENEATITEPSYRVKHGQNFALFVPDAEPAEPRGQAIALDVLFEDDDLLVIDKPAGLVVHPAPGNPDGTLVNALIVWRMKVDIGKEGEDR